MERGSRGVIQIVQNVLALFLTFNIILEKYKVSKV